MPFTTFVHKIDRAFALISQSRKQELNDLYKTHLSWKGYQWRRDRHWHRPRHIASTI